ncbi:MAG TPA: hypothetical protein VGR07_05065 [Thermoanaerobaculia bacterium]|nr:hypothetical protein [Thermoanaerobaculia bacterium]
MTDLLGAVLTLLSLGALAFGGYLLALLLLGERAAEDTLELAVAALLCATGEGVGIGLALGALGELRIELALPLSLALAAGLLAVLLAGVRRRTPVGPPARLLLRRAWARLGEHPALALLTLHAVGAEALRGLLRPPLSWDSLMYHLTLTANWVQRHDLAPVFGAYPMNYYGYVPAAGSVWLWWWMAPAHGELYANLAFLPQWALLALAAGAVARRLGARRSWPLACFLVGMTPTVVRFAATQYVDIATAAWLLAATVFGLGWLRRADPGAAVLAGAGLGLAAGTKVLGLIYGGALAAALLLLAVGRPDFRRRAGQAALALVLAVCLGGFFYLRNVAHGVGPLALACEGVPHRPAPGLPRLPRPNSVAALPHRMLGEGQLLRAFLGTVDVRSPFVDLGLGPQALLVLFAVPALLFLPRGRRREGAVVASQVLFEAAVWTTIPYAASGHVLANVRYLLPAVGLAFASGVAAAESLGAGAAPLGLLTLALLAQDVLQLHTAIPDGLRPAIAAADVLAAALLLSPALRLAVRRHARWLVAAGVFAALAAVPSFARFRTGDRARAFTEEHTAHVVTTARYAGAWAWLDRNGGAGTVDVVSSPDTFFVYPAMGPHLERRAIYVNVNASDLHEAAAYPLCQPRVDFSPDAWLVNLRREEVRWLHLSRTPPFPFPQEAEWAGAQPELFALRYSDPNNRVYELQRSPL